MKFEKIEKVSQFVPGVNYNIQYHSILKGTFLRKEGNQLIFKTGFQSYTRIQIVNHYDFYVPIFQRNRIQSDMERRAVNKILQHITGDPTFSWAEPTVPHLPCRDTLRPRYGL
jgi:hypothetical protein